MLLRRWLEEPGSLTRRLRHSCGGCFHVEVLRQQWGLPYLDEVRRLGLRYGTRAWVREVLLCCNGCPWIYARTVIPRWVLQGRLRRLQHLGRKPLGSVLFGRHPVRRGMIEVTGLTRGDALYERVASSTPLSASCWTRRSVFHIAGRPLLVTEVFLPALADRVGEGEA